jgi:hypothetical protein
MGFFPEPIVEVTENSALSHPCWFWQSVVAAHAV